MKTFWKMIDIMLIIVIFVVFVKVVIIPVRDKICEAADSVTQRFENIDDNLINMEGGDHNESSCFGSNKLSEFGRIEQRNFKNFSSVKQEFEDFTEKFNKEIN